MGERKRKKVAEALREVISQVVLFELQDPRIGFVTVTGVEISRELRQAKVSVSILGNDPDRTKALRCLEHARGHIQEQVGRRMRLRHVPFLKFELDDSTSKGTEVERLLEEAKRESRREDWE